jgi:hypothetical protein
VNHPNKQNTLFSKEQTEVTEHSSAKGCTRHELSTQWAATDPCIVRSSFGIYAPMLLLETWSGYFYI